MWIFCKDGFYSAVEDLHDENRIMVRSRSRRDIETLLFRLNMQAGEIIANSAFDYPFRCFVDRKAWSAYLQDLGMTMNHHNFKNSVAENDPDRAFKYMGVWEKLSQAFQSERPD